MPYSRRSMKMLNSKRSSTKKKKKNTRKIVNLLHYIPLSLTLFGQN